MAAAGDDRRLTRARLADATGRAAAEGAFFNEVRPGSTLALLYEDDPGVWHEALVTWPGSGANRPLAIYTPDGDHYVEYGSGPEAGPQRVALCSACVAACSCEV